MCLQIQDNGIKMLNAHFDSCTKSIQFSFLGDPLQTLLLGKKNSPLPLRMVFENSGLNVVKTGYIYWIGPTVK